MTSTARSADSLNRGLLVASVAALVVSAAVAGQALLSQGHAAFNTNNDGLAWGLPVATYVFFVLTSTGLTFVASLAMVFGMKQYYPIAKRCVWLAVATLLGGFAALALEIGHPLRLAWAIPFSFQLKSPMWWMGVFYTLYLVLLLLKFKRVNNEDWDSNASRTLGVLSFASVIVAHGTLGLVFGMMVMRPYWYDGLLPIYFLATAALSGGAFAMLAAQLSSGFDAAAMPGRLRELVAGPLARSFAAVLGLVLLFTLARTLTGLWSNADGLQVYGHFLSSPWFAVEIVAMIIAFALLLSGATRAQPAMQTLAAVLVIVALFIGRYEFVIGGQLVPLFKGSWAPGIIDYSPSLTEWMITLLAFSLAFAVYAVGEARLRLSATPVPGSAEAEPAGDFAVRSRAA